MSVSFCPNAIAWGDVATWVAAAASFAAVCAALWIAGSQIRLAKKDLEQRRRRRSLMLAMGAKNTFPWLHTSLKAARNVFSERDAHLEKGQSGYEYIKKILKLVLAVSFPPMVEYEEATIDVAKAYADLVSSVAAYNRQLEVLMQLPFDEWKIDELREYLDFNIMWDAIQARLVELVRLLVPYDSLLGRIDFAERDFSADMERRAVHADSK